MTNVLKQATAMALMVDWLRDNAANGPPKVGPQMGSVEEIATELREEIFRLANDLMHERRLNEATPLLVVSLDTAVEIRELVIERDRLRNTQPCCQVHGTRYCPDPKLIDKEKDATRTLARCAAAGCPPRNWLLP